MRDSADQYSGSRAEELRNMSVSQSECKLFVSGLYYGTYGRMINLKSMRTKSEAVRVKMNLELDGRFLLLALLYL